jgi:hypothetical protein
MVTNVKTKNPDEMESFDIAFDCIDSDGVAKNPSAVTACIFISNVSPIVYVNGRDGSVNQLTGIVTAANHVSFHLGPYDNSIVNATKYCRTGYEYHTIQFDIRYDAGVNREYHEVNIKVRRKESIT